MKSLNKIVAISVFLLTFTPVISAAITLDSDGVAGDMDDKSRNPHLTVSSHIGTNEVTILADAFHPSDEFKKYPIQFDFFINRTLFASQYRSPTLNGPVGVSVPSSVAKPPFNFVVVAKMLHPNSIYTTVIEAATSSDDNLPKLECTVTLPGATQDDEATIYTASQVSMIENNQSSTIATNFVALSQDGKTSISVDSSLTFKETPATGEFTHVAVGSDAAEVTVSGGASLTEDNQGTFASFTITSEDGESTLTCSR